LTRESPKTKVSAIETSTAMVMTSVRHGLLTKLLHAGLLLSVLWQLAASGLVERPKASQPGNQFYEIHEIVGLVTLALVLLFWIWSAVRRRETPFTSLFPWLSGRQLKAVAADIGAHWAYLRRLRLPLSDIETPPASAVHGVGLLTALAMAATGAWLYTQSIPSGLILEIHKAVSNLMWAYVVGHAGLALVHQFTGHRVLQQMFGSTSDAGQA
jgi:cytochrome b561